MKDKSINRRQRLIRVFIVGCIGMLFSVIIESNSTESKEQIQAARSGNDATSCMMQITRPINNVSRQRLRVQTYLLTSNIFFGYRQQHTEQPGLNNEGEVDQNAEQKAMSLAQQRYIDQILTEEVLRVGCEKKENIKKQASRNLDLMLTNDVLTQPDQARLSRQKTFEHIISSLVFMSKTFEQQRFKPRSSMSKDFEHRSFKSPRNFMSKTFEPQQSLSSGRQRLMVYAENNTSAPFLNVLMMAYHISLETSHQNDKKNSVEQCLFRPSFLKDKRRQKLQTLTPRPPRQHVVPFSRKDSFGNGDSAWIEAMQDETSYRSTDKNWELVYKPFARMIIKLNLYYGRNKRMKIRLEIRNKARLVAKGLLLRKRVIDFEETFAPVARLEAVRFSLPTAGTQSFPKSIRMDLKTAFLRSIEGGV
ncbi:retrovirus-related pol polyprotein from transposon TNT 1-94 [Tanacetum coccineum]|uniref:Retrovirus-related pol polyprotein from transposon TNT 1-94 n=1 Tax=Tanacetum coccineum TaxID=301880 RepID=A0ABQ5ENS7_9ASTR